MLIRNYLYLGGAVALFAAGWYVNDWRRDSADLIAQEQRDAEVQAAQKRAEEAERIAAETRVRVITKEKVITRDVIKYVQSDDRVVCEYDDERVRLRSEILRAADPRSESTH